MTLIRKFVDSVFSSHKELSAFCFRWLPFKNNPTDTNRCRSYFLNHQKEFTNLCAFLDTQSIKLVKRYIQRRSSARFLFSIKEIWSYIKSQQTKIPYWFPDNGTLLKSVFSYKAGLSFLPPEAIDILCGSDVIDGGAASGDSSIVLSDCGTRKVYAFEPSPLQQEEMRTVFSQNNKSNAIEIIPLGLGEDGKTFSTKDQYGRPFTAVTTSIDTFCQNKDICCIKLDIEGAELQALKNARNTIARCKPILLICVYHRPEDLFEIPHWLLTNFPDYRIILRDTEPANRGACVHLVMIATPR